MNYARNKKAHFIVSCPIADYSQNKNHGNITDQLESFSDAVLL